MFFTALVGGVCRVRHGTVEIWSEKDRDGARRECAQLLASARAVSILLARREKTPSASPKGERTQRCDCCFVCAPETREPRRLRGEPPDPLTRIARFGRACVPARRTICELRSSIFLRAQGADRP